MYDYRKMTPEERESVLHDRREREFPLHAPPHKPVSFEGFLDVVKQVGDYWFTLNVQPPGE